CLWICEAGPIGVDDSVRNARIGKGLQSVVIKEGRGDDEHVTMGAVIAHKVGEAGTNEAEAWITARIIVIVGGWGRHGGAGWSGGVGGGGGWGEVGGWEAGWGWWVWW